MALREDANRSTIGQVQSHRHQHERPHQRQMPNQQSMCGKKRAHSSLSRAGMVQQDAERIQEPWHAKAAVSSVVRGVHGRLSVHCHCATYHAWCEHTLPFGLTPAEPMLFSFCCVNNPNISSAGFSPICLSACKTVLWDLRFGHCTKRVPGPFEGAKSSMYSFHQAYMFSCSVLVAGLVACTADTR
jgi:hypothetical protein